MTDAVNQQAQSGCRGGEVVIVTHDEVIFNLIEDLIRVRGFLFRWKRDG